MNSGPAAGVKAPKIIIHYTYRQGKENKITVRKPMTFGYIAEGQWVPKWSRSYEQDGTKKTSPL